MEETRGNAKTIAPDFVVRVRATSRREQPSALLIRPTLCVQQTEKE